MEGAALHDPSSDDIFINELKKNLDPEIKIIEVNGDINTRDIAQSVVGALAESLRTKG